MCMFELEQLNIEIIKQYLMKLINKGLSSSIVQSIKNVLKAIYITYEDQYGLNHINFSLVKIEQDKKENEYPLPDGVKRVISDITEEEITGSRIVNFGRRFVKLRMIWKTERPDVILSFIGKNNMMAILTSRFLPTLRRKLRSSCISGIRETVTPTC